jgi:hypothetical protein
MKIKEIKNIDSKFAWSFLGVLLGLIFGGLSVYSVFFQIKRPEIHFEITNDSDVLEFNEKVGLLDITYDSISLSRSNQALRIVTFKVINKGQQDILSTLYDDSVPLGFSILNGKFVEIPRVVSPSDEYFVKNLKINTDTLGNATFSRVIIESQKSFTIKSLILYNIGNQPILKAFGKIAGMDTIYIDNLSKSRKETSFFNGVVNGSFAIQVIRFLIYGIPAIILCVLLIIVLIYLDDWKEKRKKVNIVNLFKNYHKNRLTVNDDLIFNIYLKKNFYNLIDFQKLLKDENELKSTYALLKNPDWEKPLQDTIKNIAVDKKLRRKCNSQIKNAYIYRRLLEIGILIEDDMGVKIDNCKNAILDDFLQFVTNQQTKSKLFERDIILDSLDIG